VAQPGLQTPTTPPTRARAPRSRSSGLLAGGTAGNELLTACTGAVLIVTLAVLGVTIVRIGSLLWLHLFVGLVLIGPLALKLASTGYRFVRYYTHDPVYVEHGPPELALRLLGPLVVISTLVVFVSGVVLLLGGPSFRSTWFPVHKLSFFAWLAIMAVHVLGHLPAVGASLKADYGPSIERYEYGVPGRSGRAFALASALGLGLVLAVLLIGQFGPWVNHQALFHVFHLRKP
jgi:hypothetical protein